MACYYELNRHGAEISCGSCLTSGLVLSALDAAYLSVLHGGFWDWHGHGLHLSSRLWFMVLVWTLVVDPITRLVFLVSSLTVSVRIGRLSLLKSKTKHFFVDAFVFTHKMQCMEMCDCESYFLFHNNPVHHCPSQHAGETMCQMRSWHHLQSNTTGSRVTTGTIKSGWLRDVYSTDLIFDRRDPRTAGCMLGQITTRGVPHCTCKKTTNCSCKQAER